MVTRIVLALFAAGLVSAPIGASDRMAYPMNVSTANVQKILFDVQEGNFVLRGALGAKEIRMMVSIDRMWIFKLGEQDILKRLIRISGEGTPEVTIRTEIPHAISSFGRAQYPIDFEVVVPNDASLEIHDTSGSIEIMGMKGDVAVQDGSGTVALRDLSGGVFLRKKSGDIRISDAAGTVTIESETGQMNIRHTGALDIRDANGNITVAGAASAQVRSRGGNLRISDVKRDLKVDNESGEIVIARVGGKVDVRDTSGQIRVQDAGPVSIHDTSGDITVRRAASLEVLTKESGRIAAGGIAGPIHVPSGFKVNQLQTNPQGTSHPSK